MKKRKTILREVEFFKIALEGGENGNFAWENFDHSMLLSC